MVLFVVWMLFLVCDLACCQHQVECSSQSTCSQCLMIPYCVWCSTPGSAGCVSRITTESCLNFSVDPNTTIDINPLPLGENNQVSVRSVQMKLRVGEPQSFSVSVKAAKNFPLDLYMLMDLSASFESDLVTVKTISSEIVSAVRNLTSRFQVGFGTFVDKTTAPFNSPLALRLAYNLSGELSACSGMPCSRPVSYEHVVNLTNSTDLFSESVQDLLISTSSDDAEGTLDAMMQAVVCTDVVGWREEARKVLLVMTDDLMHTAGDGRLAAIYQPNDARCHTQYDPTESKTLYLASLEYDYPTIEQVRIVMEQFGVVPVFATSANLNYFSNVIAPMLGGFADELTTNSDNIVTVIREANEQIESRVSINYEQNEAISLSIMPICPNGSNLVEDKSQCVNVSGQTVEFNITVTLTSCTERLKEGDIETIRAYIPGFGQFSLEVEGVCSCDCDDDDIEPFSSACLGNGNLTCGQCTCSDGWSGNDCSCSTASCDEGPNNQECSGRGSCVCGQCVCNQPNTTYPGVSTPSIFGKTCECDNFLCDRGVNGAVCSGQGTCTCTNGEYSCSCFNSTITGRQHEGTACQCSYDNCVDPMDSCRDTHNTSCLVCSGRGSCNPCAPTGLCRCDGDITTTSYCVPIGPVTQASCDADANCILCLAKQQQCSQPCTNYLTIDVSPPKGYQIPGSTEGSTSKCSDIRDDQCTYDYYIAYSNNGSTLVRVGPPSCLLLPPWAIAVVTLAGVIVIGVILFIVVKLCLVWLDYRELKRFQNEVKEADFSKNENPMFQAPSVTYKNVAYGQVE